MAIRIIQGILLLIALPILVKGIIIPLGSLFSPIIKYLVRLFFPLLQKSEIEKQKEALEFAKERVRIAEIQKETIQTEKKAMRIQDSIINEEFEEVDNNERFKRL